MTSRALFLLALLALAAIPAHADDQERSLDDWVQALQASEPAERVNAAEALGALGARADPAVPALVRLLDDANDEVGLACVRALSAIGGEIPAVVVPLLVARVTLRDRHGTVLFEGAHYVPARSPASVG